MTSETNSSRVSSSYRRSLLMSRSTPASWIARSGQWPRTPYRQSRAMVRGRPVARALGSARPRRGKYPGLDTPSRSRMPRPDRECRATTSGETALPTPEAVRGFLEHADAEGFPETVLSRRGDGHGAAVLHPFGPAQIEATLGEGGSQGARDVRPSFGPIEAQSTEGTAG